MSVNSNGYLYLGGNIRNIYILLLLSLSFGDVTDIDGNVYETIQIGEQVWMAENLKTTKYRDGSDIPNITNNGDWGGLSTGAYGDYDNNPTNSETYGRLYNWFVVDDDRGVCPDGWHVPSDAEYTVLTDYLGGESVAGGKMKEAGLGHWNSPNTGATNESGFTALPAGYRVLGNGTYVYMGGSGYFWSSSEDSSLNAWYRILFYNSSNVTRYSNYRHYGFSIRCLETIEGCTHPNATNYDETANVDNGSCEYETVQIGHQVWMQENLKATYYRNGDAIATGLDDNSWASTTEGAYAIYNNDPVNAEIYGNLYNWYTVDDNRGVCPEGFHIPSDNEYTNLTDYLGGESVAGGKMKEAGLEHWNSPNTGATNESGFTGLPAGLRYYNPGNYYYMGTYGYFWSSSEASSSNAWSRGLNHNLSSVYRGSDYNKHYGVNIRCLSDETLTITISVPDDFATIQEAIDYSIDGDTILVSAGTYLENINFNGKNIALIGEDIETTIIDGGGNGVVVSVNSENSEFKNFTVTNGYQDGGFGGGIQITGGTPLIDNVVIDGNTGAAHGGGIAITSGSPIITNSIIKNNTAHTGGGVYCTNSSPYFSTTLIADNVSIWSSQYNGGDGGGFTASNCTPTLVKVTIANNTADIGTAINLAHGGTHVTLSNSIVIGEVSGGGSMTATYSAIQWEGEGNIDEDCQFTDPENEDFTLQPSSPCIDAGDPDLDGDGTDFDGSDDILGNEDDDIDDQDLDGTRTDMGAYPFFHIWGCIDDESACNYDVDANTEDGSCNMPDCAGECNGEESGNNDLDDCDTCDDDSSNDCIDYCLDLHEGANLISFYALPEDISITHVMSSIEGNATGVIGQGVAANYNGTEWMGSLNTISSLSGYWVKVSGAVSLCIEDGIPTDPAIQYSLESGANLISFPIGGSVEISSSLPDDIEGFVSGIIGEGVAANNQPPWQGSLSNLSGGNGYWMITTDDISFSFDVSTMSRVKFDNEVGLTAPDNKEIHQSTKQAFYFIEDIENIEQGDIIHTYSNGINVGSRVWNGGFTDVPAMGDDGSKFTAGYCIAGSIPTFKVEKANGSLITLTGDIPEWSDNQLYMVGYLEESIALPAVYSLSTAYPNPFNPTTTLSFAIPIDSKVSLSVYNLQGREISTLIDANMEAGYHSIVWDANSYASGVYFVKMMAGEYISTQKLMLIK